MKIPARPPRSRPSATCFLAFLAAAALITGCGPSSTFKATLAKAKAGDPQAQMEVGQMYLDGRDVKQDGAEGLSWIKQAALKGFPPAERTYGMILRVAPPPGGNVEQGRQWLEKAAHHGDTLAQIELAGIHGLFSPPFDYVEAMKWVLIAEKGGATNTPAIKKMLAAQMSASEVAKARARADEFVVEK